MKKLFLLTAAAALFAACSTDNTELVVGNDNEELVPLRVTANIDVKSSVTTRAYNDAWEANDAIGVFGVRTGEKPANASNTIVNGKNAQYSTSLAKTTAYNDLGSFSSEAPVYLPANGAAIDVYAYYPYNSGSFEPTAVPANVNSDQSTAANYHVSDFMRAFNDRSEINSDFEPNGSTTIVKATPSTQLGFKHKLSKLQFVITKGNGIVDSDIANISSVTISGQPTTATYNIYENGDASATNPLNITDNTPETITACNTVTASSGTVTYEAIVYPNKNGSTDVTNNAPGDRTVTITMGSANYSFTIPSATVFNSGYEYVYNIRVNAASLSVTAAIKPWTTSSTSYLMTEGSTLADLKSLITNATAATNYSATYLGRYVLADGTITSSSVSAVGQIAYISESDVDAGKTGSRILVVATEDEASTYTWKTAATSGESTYNINTALNGLGFTTANHSDTYPAAKVAYEHAAARPAGASIWFLPSYQQLVNVKAYLTASTSYWTATENSGTNTNADYYTTAATPSEAGSGGNAAKNTASTYHVRAIFAY